MITPIRGYAEGYYGRLFTWQERLRVLDTLHRLGMNTYYYAPKEDPRHRLHWRTDYPASWYDKFQRFTETASERGIRVVAGVAPGLDFDFNDLPDGKDFCNLSRKCARLLEHGAHAISLLLDDIDADFHTRSAGFSNEGVAHATLANQLAEVLQHQGDAIVDESGSDVHQDSPASSSLSRIANGRCANLSLWVTPRIYADELIDEAPDYLAGFIKTLQEQHHVLYCGSDVVAHTLDATSTQAITAASQDRSPSAPCHRVILWDNLYANDYCPRRLFVGPWRHRQAINDVLLNPTGMVNTDCLLLELMSCGLQQHESDDASALVSAWRTVLQSHGVPEQFLAIAACFDAPVFNGVDEPLCVEVTEAMKGAIEYCLWRWKSPLAREWYAAIFGLKHDLLTCEGTHPALRIRKTQTAALAQVLLRADTELNKR